MVHGEQGGHEGPLAELRRQLADGLARAQLTQTMLAHRAGLGRTTVAQALSPRAKAPSAATVTAMARVLRLPDGDLLSLLRDVAGEPRLDPTRDEGPGKPIEEWDPHDLEIHPAGTGFGAGAPPQRALPGYVRRAHDLVLAEAVEAAAAGDSRMLILVGSSSTGKTRACWEAVQPLAARGWRLWHPYDPTRAEAALADLNQVAPRTVVWFNEAQHYFGHPQAGERIAAALHSLLTCPDRRPVLVLGTLWREYADSYAALPQPDGLDPHSRVRELLTGRTVPVPDAFDQDALNKAEGLARGGDRLLADALTRADNNGRVAQDLAGAPELLRRYEHGTPPARALLEAAMDARRLGAGLHLPQAFLKDAATDYLTDHDYDELTDDWAQTAFVNLARPGHGKQAPLRRTNPRPLRHPPGAPVQATAPALEVGMAFRLADYLEQHGRITRQSLCPPTSFWHAAHTHLAADDLNNLSLAAEQRYRLRWAHDLSQRAADEGDADAWIHLADLRMRARDLDAAEALARQAADAGNGDALTLLARIREAAGDLKGAEDFARQAAAAGRTNALTHLAGMREAAGDLKGAEAFAQQAVAAGDTYALTHLARMRERAEDLKGAEDFARQAADAGHADALTLLADLRMRAEDLEGAEDFARQAAAAGRTYVLTHHARKRGEDGDLDAAETLARQAADAGDADALTLLARIREAAGDLKGAEDFARQAAAAGRTNALTHLAQVREVARDWEGAEVLAQQAADAGHLIRLVQLRRAVAVGGLEGGEGFARQAAAVGHTDALTYLAQMREAAGDLKGAEYFAQLAAAAGDTDALTLLARIREAAGDLEGAEGFARRAAVGGQYFPLLRLGWRLEEAGNLESAEGLLRQAADAGRYIDGVGERARWPHGLDPDGSPTPPWN
ncbi:hypothetical protein [Streptomyces virginiae]|uniref:hypothetical protein n=1 Tax=Streptomyces virginiae TaxID=1961 RepID=UPI003655CA73